MIKTLFVCIIALNTVRGSPQFVTFKDGKVGVNFGGYNAEAGLGGLLTGNTADGGLSASAGTPFGQRAAAGIGGNVKGNAAGTAYAGAQASDTVGASAIISGSTASQQSGIIGAEAHSNGKHINKVVSSGNNLSGASLSTDAPIQLVPKQFVIQKVKPPKKYATATNIESRFSSNVPQQKSTVIYSQPGHQQAAQKQVQLNVGALDSFFNIPIGILQSIRDNLQPIGINKQLIYSKTV